MACPSRPLHMCCRVLFAATILALTLAYGVGRPAAAAISASHDCDGINIVDLTTLVTRQPPMLFGARNFGAVCPWP